MSAVTTHATTSSSGETQAQRLERVYGAESSSSYESLVSPRAIFRMPPGGDDWSAMQTTRAHDREMIPYWLSRCPDSLVDATVSTADVRAHRRVAGAVGGCPRCGAPTRTRSNHRRLHEEVQAAAGVIRSAADEGSPRRRGERLTGGPSDRGRSSLITPSTLALSAADTTG